MKKVPTTALGIIALTAFLTAGCASIEEVRKELTSVKDDLKDLQASNTSLQSQLTAAGETIDDLEAKVATFTTAPGEPGAWAYSRLTYEFKHFEPAAGVKGEVDARVMFWKNLKEKISAWGGEKHPLFHLRTKWEGTKLTVSSTKAIISEEDKGLVHKDITDLLGIDIAAVQTTEHESVSVGELTSTLVSVSGGVKSDPTCAVELIYKPKIEGEIASARTHWLYTQNGEVRTDKDKKGEPEIRVNVNGTLRTATALKQKELQKGLLPRISQETEVCVPTTLEDEKTTVYIMIVTKAEETLKAAHYRELQTEGMEVTKDELVYAPLTIDHPGCPPPSWNAGPTATEATTMAWIYFSERLKALSKLSPKKTKHCVNPT